MAGFCLALLSCLLAGTLPGQAPWRLVEEVRVGSPDPGPASFNDIRGLATNRQGWLFVLDFAAQDIRIFDAAGRYLRTEGRKGSGPGEMRWCQRAPLTTAWA